MDRWKNRCAASRLLRWVYAAILVVAVASTAGHARQASSSTAAPQLLFIDADGRRHELGEDAFLALPRTTLITRTAWTEGPQTFEGVLMRDVLAAARIDAAALGGRVIEALALNDYSVLIPVDDILAYDIVVARFMNGKPLTRRDKGPYWIVYPRDAHRELADSRYDHRWVWQLRQLQVQ